MIICALPLPCIGARKPKTEDLNGSGSGLPFSTKGSPHVQNRFERRAAARAPLGRTLHGNFPGTYFRPAEKGWSSNMIEVKNLTKRYGTNTALNNVSFTVEEGTIVGFLGPNGAGKSTTMNIITGYLSATSGSVTVQGKNTLENPNEVKKLIGYLPELPPLYLDMTVKSYLNFIFDLKKCKLPRKSHLTDICELCKITDVKERIIKHLSKGYKQRVGLAQALIGNPPVLILDEPTVGLDPKQMVEIRTLIKKLGKNHTVILSSHILSEIQAVCDRVVIINKGEIAADDTAGNLSKKISTDHRLILRIEGNKDEILYELRKIEGIKYVRADMEREPGVFEFELEAEEGIDLRREINKTVQKHGWPILMMNSSEMTLEDIFLKITMGEGVPDQLKKLQEARPYENESESGGNN